ncbi:dehydrogenase/oxidoreductase [Yamadazyma tenuis]|uniref:NAD(P)-binding protein n=1 Tax=Candida tenuis (strain ATCC 10573 / BCRC 21748 / CBS 615 / JCM 9827 / NBRC 10315 / NRRL Y-1498 / VKM Y-70) TaxID=590646 RepID=G3B1P8_CANTC|nr:NAD(P)-binding protein [Yamadazyma tenuis ATCC 10573]XP_006685804.1 uncharacterized protein CANTEDRAFT_113268 [Yamadazyma tenuis ATCC 10573]EGV64997.1 NAD(P)-binding protein [Yamadazyma tenuis ATCC 10573]EGV64998.1 hypothetical protein CANTEDRAFT_113268 [Yamadazyma tenuis ATCC 10573]WEJ97263.1 dehydrogenase/oxidoreductase [Yamadazyma tenuis]
MSPKNLNIAVIGTGIFANDAHLPTFNKIPYLTPIACYNRTKAKAETFAERANIDKSKVYDSLEKAFEDKEVDFVDALLPVQFNLDVVKLAVKHNKPLALEKPVAANLTQAAEIVKIAESTDLPIGILENWAFYNAVGALQDQLPKIGDVTAFTYKSTGPWNTNNKYLATTWRQKPEHVGGFLSDGGVHQMTLLTEVLGSVETISANTVQLREESGDQDTLFSTIKLQSGAIGTFVYGSAFGASEKKLEFAIYGKNGSLVYTLAPAEGKPSLVIRIGKDGNSGESQTIAVEEGDSYEKEFVNFADAVTANDKSVIAISPRKAFHHLAIVDAALKSSKDNGASVTIQNP